MNISNISVSRKGVWDECSQKYKYKYHLKLESPFPEPEYFLYGSIIHKCAEVSVKEKGKRPLDEICKLVLSGEIPLERDENNEEIKKLPQLSDEYKKKLPSHLAALQKLNNEIGYEDNVVEKEFLLDLDPPNNKCVKGFIDRVVRRGEHFFIFDYKTSKKNHFRKNRGNIHKDLQLRTYARVIQKEYGVPAKNIRAALYYLEGANLIGATFSEESLIKAENELLNVYNQIENTPEDKAWGNVGDHCVRCEFRKLCPYYRVS